MSKRAAAAQRALERAVDEETATLRAELKAKDAEVRALHTTLSRIAGIAFGAVGAEPGPVSTEPLEKRVLPAVLAAAAAPAPAEEPIWHEPPIDLAGEDDLGPGRFL